MKALLLKKQTRDSDGMEVREIQGQGYTQTEFSQQVDTKDPRIGGTKIIFDSRLSDITKASETDQLRAFMKVKTDEKARNKPKMTDLEQQKQMLA